MNSLLAWCSDGGIERKTNARGAVGIARSLCLVILTRNNATQEIVRRKFKVMCLLGDTFGRDQEERKAKSWLFESLLAIFEAAMCGLKLPCLSLLRDARKCDEF